ncbi:MAG: hypothetical protein K2L86_14670 [Lachnospiraceae bacterium]|nr:hypothetical protein [Lachnospiraceae bacterium]
MEIKINHELRMDSGVPFQSVVEFRFEWMPNQHAVLEVDGYTDRDILYGKDTVYDSKIRIWKEQNNETLFYGYVINVTEELAGGLKYIQIKAKSASCRLDQNPGSRSFQAVNQTYAETARKAVEDSGGQIICTEGNEMPIKKPVIQYDETVWAFSRRLASHLETCVVPDIISGEPALWFGMRNGSAIPPFSENEYTIQIARTGHGDGKQTETGYETESRVFYKLGDKVVFGGQRLRIYGVSARFQHGELIFRYLLKSKADYAKFYQEQFTGLGLTGTVVDVRREQVKVALDIDGGKTTGEFNYDWYPVTGNALYAMPEKGARVEVYFGSRDEQEGVGGDCFLNISDYRDFHIFRQLNAVNRSRINLFDQNVYFSRVEKNNLSLSDGYISMGNPKNLEISSRKKINMGAKKVVIIALDELNICQD